MRLEELETLLQTLIGEHVAAKTIAGNSLSLWISVEPSSPSARRLWIDPPWRIENGSYIEASSYGFPYDKEDGESEEQYRSRFEEACSKSDFVKGLRINVISVNKTSSDILVKFEDGRVLRSFVVDLEYENWHFADHVERKRYGVWNDRVEVEDYDV